MMTTSSNYLSKRPDYYSGSMSNLMLRSDGFKRIVKGLTYKRGSTTNIITSINTNPKSNHNGAYTSMGKRTVNKEY